MARFDAVHDVESRSLEDNYIVLGLRIANAMPPESKPYFVDFYYGPPKLRRFNSAVSGRQIPSMSPGHCVDMAETILERIHDLGEDMDGHRFQILYDQINALYHSALELAGKSYGYAEKVRLLYGLDLGVPEIDAFKDAVDAFCSARKCDSASFRQELVKWDQEHELDPEKALCFREKITENLRERTKKILGLPEGEKVILTSDPDLPSSGYNWYHRDDKGNDAKFTSYCPSRPSSNRWDYVIANTMAHETYPGHHTHHSTKERELFDRMGFSEASVSFLPTPEYTIIEGIAQCALEVLFPDGLSEMVEIINQITGRSYDPEVEGKMIQSVLKLSMTNSLEGYFLHEAGLSPDEVVRMLMPISVRNEAYLRRRLTTGFVAHPLFGPYVQTYKGGHDIVKMVLDRGGQEALKRLYSEQHTVSTAMLLADI